MEKNTIVLSAIIQTPNKRLLKQHMKKHLKVPKYFCKKCGKGHVHNMQFEKT